MSSTASRSVRVIDLSQTPTREPHRQKVQRGEIVATLEAMKMQAAVSADMDGEVEEVLVQPQMQVDAKDLLVVLATP